MFVKVQGKYQLEFVNGAQGDIRHADSANEVLLKPLRCAIDKPPDPLGPQTAVH